MDSELPEAMRRAAEAAAAAVLRQTLDRNEAARAHARGYVKFLVDEKVFCIRHQKLRMTSPDFFENLLIHATERGFEELVDGAIHLEGCSAQTFGLLLRYARNPTAFFLDLANVDVLQLRHLLDAAGDGRFVMPALREIVFRELACNRLDPELSSGMLSLDCCETRATRRAPSGPHISAFTCVPLLANGSYTFQVELVCSTSARKAFMIGVVPDSLARTDSVNLYEKPNTVSLYANDGNRHPGNQNLTASPPLGSVVRVFLNLCDNAATVAFTINSAAGLPAVTLPAAAAVGGYRFHVSLHDADEIIRVRRNPTAIEE
eukprot:gnl/Spiro4/25769_TR12818_c0_g1_i1.p1 gnl/Spiro4/25769_TR12818_c0_g1~~gnl/Spiro4/25769_TR12818_c0_g1_i1.p1  ORF type:complete len:327 (+),score=74.81 gnl/Spiro4/25769_TR12818_c0_g1_i1:30-983(+)